MAMLSQESTLPYTQQVLVSAVSLVTLAEYTPESLSERSAMMRVCVPSMPRGVSSSSNCSVVLVTATLPAAIPAVSPAVSPVTKSLLYHLMSGDNLEGKSRSLAVYSGVVWMTKSDLSELA